ncbi:MAG: hypothetical protein ACLFT7_05275 [Thermoplasmata archaeon]
MKSEQQNAENRLVLDCPCCHSKNIEPLESNRIEGATTDYSENLTARCNDCRELFEIEIAAVVINPYGEKAQELQGARA